LDVIADTIGALLKYQDDIQRLEGSEARRLLDAVRDELATA
ncbi:MoxR family ATPase, partial [Rhodovulum sulfidophilum]|nr:MoxR family ATPase [Rhodovulum sulfidophilum]